MANLDGVDRSHYERFKIQPIEFIAANKLPWAEGEIIKYICRHPYKNGLEDLRKARDILDRMISDAEQERYMATSQLQAAEHMKAKSYCRPIDWLTPWPKGGVHYG